jgi:hypothetical protein
LRVDVRDLAGNQTSAKSPAGFALVDTSTSLAVGPPRSTGTMLAPPAPSPANDRARIAYELPARATVALAVFDLQGRKVAVLDRGVREPGRHGAAIDTSHLRPGVYLIRLETGGARAERRLLVVH